MTFSDIVNLTSPYTATVYLIQEQSVFWIRQSGIEGRVFFSSARLGEFSASDMSDICELGCVILSKLDKELIGVK